MKIFYLDSFLLLNLLLDYLLLILTAKLSGVPVKRRFAWISAVLGAAFAVGIFFFASSKLKALLFGLFTAWAMVSITFSSVSQRKRIRLTGIFLVQTLGFSGFMEFLQNIGVGRISVQNGVLYIQIEFWQILFAAAGAFFLVQLCFRDHSLKLTKQRIMLHAELAGKQLDTLLLVDSGNLLREPLSGKPVILLAPTEVAKLLPEEASMQLGDYNWDAGRLMGTLVERGIPTRLISFETATKERMLTVAVKPKNITLKREGKTEYAEEYWLGIARRDIDICGGCRGLIGI